MEYEWNSGEIPKCIHCYRNQNQTATFFTQFFTLFKVIKSINYLNPHAISHSNSVLVQMAQMQQYKQLFRLEVTLTLDKRLMVHYVVSAIKQKIHLPTVK